MQDPYYPDPGYFYFPLQENFVKTYRVQRVDYFLQVDTGTGNVVTVADTSLFLLKKEMLRGPEDPNGQETWFDQVYTKKDTSSSWPFQPDSIELVRNTDVDLLISRNNRVYSELRFPVRKGITWDGNFFNALPSQTYTIDSLGFLWMIDSLHPFQPCLRVQKSEISNQIEEAYRYEVYAEGKGPVFKYDKVLAFKQNPGGDTTGIQKIERGFIEIWNYDSNLD